MAGILGEYAACHYLGAAKHNNTYDWDISLRGATIDVKSKVRNNKPRVDYGASIPNITRRQDCDYYMFASVKRDFSKVFLMGYIPTDLFFKQAKFLKPGDSDGTNTFRARCETYNLAYSELFTVGELNVEPDGSI